MRLARKRSDQAVRAVLITEEQIKSAILHIANGDVSVHDNNIVSLSTAAAFPVIIEAMIAEDYKHLSKRNVKDFAHAHGMGHVANLFRNKFDNIITNIDPKKKPAERRYVSNEIEHDAPFLCAANETKPKSIDLIAGGGDETSAPELECGFSNASSGREWNIDRSACIYDFCEEHGISAAGFRGQVDPSKPKEGIYKIINFPAFDTQVIVPVAPPDREYQHTRGVLVMKGIKNLGFYGGNLNYEQLRRHEDIWVMDRFTSDTPMAWAEKLLALVKTPKDDMPIKKKRISWSDKGSVIRAVLYALVDNNILQIKDRALSIADSFQEWGIYLPHDIECIQHQTWNALNNALHKHASNKGPHIKDLPCGLVSRDNQGRPVGISSITYAINWMRAQREVCAFRPDEPGCR